jgi:hypothetical protein
MTRSTLQKIVDINKRLGGPSMVANLDFGHADPILTIPVGGRAWLDAADDGCRLEAAERLGPHAHAIVLAPVDQESGRSGSVSTTGHIHDQNTLSSVAELVIEMECHTPLS